MPGVGLGHDGLPVASELWEGEGIEVTYGGDLIRMLAVEHCSKTLFNDVVDCVVGLLLPS